jgi:hypothetical protein
MERSRICSIFAAGVLAFGAMTLAASPANSKAQTEAEIEKGCKAANGGTYVSRVVDGVRYSTCCYKDIKGLIWCDQFKNGVYTETLREPSPDPSKPAGVPPPVVDQGVSPPPAPPDPLAPVVDQGRG